MTAVLRHVKGSPGKPLHPPLTDASIGAYTLGVAALIAGKAGLETPQLANAALIGISLGLLAAPTAITGLLDWLDIPKGTPARTAATIHLQVFFVGAVGWCVCVAGQSIGQWRPSQPCERPWEGDDLQAFLVATRTTTKSRRADTSRPGSSHAVLGRSSRGLQVVALDTLALLLSMRLDTRPSCAAPAGCGAAFA
jgi:hypothetical protein